MVSSKRYTSTTYFSQSYKTIPTITVVSVRNKNNTCVTIVTYSYMFSISTIVKSCYRSKTNTCSTNCSYNRFAIPNITFIRICNYNFIRVTIKSAFAIICLCAFIYCRCTKLSVEPEIFPTTAVP